MATSKVQNMIGHIAMDDGTQYDVKVTYYNDKGEAVPCGSGSTLSKEAQQELESLIKTMAVAHARKASKTFKQLPVVHLDHSGVTFPDKSTHSHELDLEPAEKSALPAQDQTFTKVNQLWEKTSRLLVAHYQGTLDDCIEIPVSAKAAQEKAPTTSIDLTVTPGSALPSAPPLDRDSDSPPPSYRTNPPSPTSLGGQDPEQVTHRDQGMQADSLSAGAREKQGAHIAADTIATSPPWYTALRHPVASVQRMFARTPTPPLNLGSLPRDFDYSSLQGQEEDITRRYLTLPPTPELPQPKKTLFGRSSTPSAPPAPPQLPDFSAQTELSGALDTFIQNAQAQAATHGIGAVIEVMNIACNRLIANLPATGAEGYEDEIRAHFKHRLNEMVIAESAKKRGDKAFVEKLWEILDDEARNGLKAYGRALTKTSLGLF